MKPWIKYTGIVLAILLLINYLWLLRVTSYSGNQDVVFLENKTYTSLKDIINRPEFKNKVVYVDIWGTSCPPCFDELQKYSPLLTNHYKRVDDVVFLYICIDRHPMPEVRWKGKVKELTPKGYHVLVRGGTDEELSLTKDVFGKLVKGKFFPYIPFYIIIDKNGHIVGKPSPNPNYAELQPDSKALLYHKIDSVRTL